MLKLSRLLPWALLLAVSPLPAETTVKVTVDESAAGARLVLQHSSKIGYVIDTSRGRVRVRYADRVKLDPPSARFDGKLIERYRLRDGRTISIETGPDYNRYETFELRNPFRVVVDLKPEPTKVSKRDMPSTKKQSKTIIVLDPGHGGVEKGAVGSSGSLEKELTLAIARRLRRELERRNPSISVVLTRDEDRLLALDERTAIANHNQADLFVSIHANASRGSSAAGAETYYLSTDATDEAARQLAIKENNSTRAAERVRNGQLDLVLWDLAQNQHLAASSALAESIQRQLNALTGTRNRGVRQAPFRVLQGAMMPAVLVEVGFISNPQEESKLRSTSYRTSVVEALAAAVEEFLLDLKLYSAPKSGARRPAAAP